MRGIRGLLAFAVAAAGLVALPVRANHLPGGPIILMGIDAEDGGVGGHGPTSTYANVVNDLLGNATKGSGILVLGGGKNPTDNVTQFWNAVGVATGQTITYANGNAVGTVSFAPFEIVAIVSSQFQTVSGGLTTAENALLATRDLDIATQVNTGGGLLGFSQDGFNPLYPYLDEIGTFTVTPGGSDSDVTATAEGLAVGLDHVSLDVCCWHDTYVAFPSFLLPLAHYTGTSRVGAIGGRNVHVLTICEPDELQVSITRPAAGRLYQDNVDIGSSGTPEAAARGSALTVNVSTTQPASKVDFFLDGLLVGTDLSAPFSFPVTLPLVAGLHTIKARALHASEPCVADGEAPLRIVCFDAVAAITRPVAGRLYQNDVELGSSGVPEAATLGGNLTLNATSSLPARTLRVEFRLDGVLVGTDLTSPYSAVVNTTPLTPGLHSITATVFEFVPTCDDSISIGLRKPDPSVLGIGVGVSVATDVPTEGIVTAGGASIGGSGGSQDVRVLDRNAPPNVDHVRTIVDKADGTAGATGTATASSILQSVSLMSGAITADVLESHASVTVNGPTQTVTTSDAGSRILGLRVQGTPVDVAQPNTVVAVPGVGTLVLQETIPSVDGLRGELTVNALHLFLDAGYAAQEIVLGSAHAGVNFIGNAFTGPASDLIHREDDLHLGADAGDTEATATALPEGIHSGAISRGDTSDFYTFQAGQGDRIVAAVKPAERTRLRVNPPPAPPALVHERPSLELYLRDPLGRVRSVGDINAVGSEPQKVELNADTPYDPPGERGRWTLEVRRDGGSALDAFYTLEFSLLPLVLREQNDADVTGDAPDTCLAGPRAIAQSPLPEEESDVAFAGVIREADGSDFYSVNVQAGRVLTVTMKPDELADGADFNLFLYGPGRTDGPVDCAVVIHSSTLGMDGAKAIPDVVFRTPVIISGDYVFEVRRHNGVGNYYVNVNVTNSLPTTPDNDAQTAADAGDNCATATPLATGVYQGTLIDRPDQDVEDWYTVSLSPNQDLIVVMKPADPTDFQLEVYQPDCVTPAAADQGTTGPQPLSVPEVARTINAAGAYKIRVVRDASVAAGNYMLAVFVTP